MGDNEKAAEILRIYKQLRQEAADVDANLLFSAAERLACPWQWMGTATGMEAARTAAEQPKADKARES